MNICNQNKKKTNNLNKILLKKLENEKLLLNKLLNKIIL